MRQFGIGNRYRSTLLKDYVINISSLGPFLGSLIVWFLFRWIAGGVDRLGLGLWINDHSGQMQFSANEIIMTDSGVLPEKEADLVRTSIPVLMTAVWFWFNQGAVQESGQSACSVRSWLAQRERRTMCVLEDQWGTCYPFYRECLHSTIWSVQKKDRQVHETL